MASGKARGLKPARPAVRRSRRLWPWQRTRVRFERARASLFFVPAIFVVAAAAAAAAMLQIDLYLLTSGVHLPAVLQTTPDSARSLLGTVASATITVAGVVFAITLVSIQLAASQFSPRVIPGFLRDSRQQRVMGLAVGTFAYCLIVLRAIKGPTETMLGFVPHTASALSLAAGDRHDHGARRLPRSQRPHHAGGSASSTR